MKRRTSAKRLSSQSKQNNVKHQPQVGVWKVFNKSLVSRKVAFKACPGFQRTFSTVNRKIPLVKLEQYGIKGLLLNFFKHTKITQYTRFNHAESISLPLRNVIF